MTWTFDPLVSRNARFNLTKLGAHAVEYLPDFYGAMEDGINSNDEKIHLTLVSIKEDVTEIKERERSYVTREGFAFYEKAFWIIASAVGSMLVGAIFYVITRSGGN